MSYIIHQYDLHETQPGYYERRFLAVHGEEFGGECELFDTEEDAIADFEDWLKDSGYDTVERADEFTGWGVVWRCTQSDSTTLVSIDVLDADAAL